MKIISSSFEAHATVHITFGLYFIFSMLKLYKVSSYSVLLFNNKFKRLNTAN